MIITNLHLKILSAIIAVCLWVYLVTGEFQEVSLYVPVKLTNIPEGYVAVTAENLVNVLAKGPKSLIKEKQLNKVQISIDVSNMGQGANSRVITSDDVQIPAGIQVTDIEPKSIDITVDSLIKKKMKVTPSFIGEPAEGYKVGSVVVSPEVVEVNAAKSKIKGVNSLETMPVNLTGKKDKITYSIGLKFFEGVQDYKPEQVEVVVGFKEDIIEKTVENIPVTASGVEEGLIVSVDDTINLNVKGRADLLNPRSIANILNPHVDLTGIIASGTYKKKIYFKESSIIKVLDTEPAKVRVEVRQ
ncbi:MAG: YbbR-like domain-containing protein [Deferribacterales bacterium]